MAWSVVLTVAVFPLTTLAQSVDRELQSTASVALVRPATWAWRNVIQQRLSVGGADRIVPKRAPELSPLLVHASPDTDVVMLQPFWVNGDRIEAELHSLFRRQEKHAKEEAVLKNAGIGMHSVHYGHFGAGVVTVFYIPVFAGFGFSW